MNEEQILKKAEEIKVARIREKQRQAAIQTNKILAKKRKSKKS